MATALSMLLPRLALMAPLVPQPVALFALREAAISFCRQTKVVTEILPAISIVAGTSSYPLVSADPTQARATLANADPLGFCSTAFRRRWFTRDLA